VTFELVRARFQFRAEQSLFLPVGKSANMLRGALGMLLRKTASPGEYSRIFEPKANGQSASGLKDWPRPFVLRAAHLDGAAISPGSAFHFDVHVFDLEERALACFEKAFARLAEEGLGPGRGRAVLLSTSRENVLIELNPPARQAAGVRVRFVTATELKCDGKLVTRPEFATLFGRVRDRVSTLRALYGGGPLEIDFRGMGERASNVRLVRCELKWIEAARRSARTGQTHPLGGLTGEAEYHGDIGEFLPYLRAGEWTGVGRQTVWGKGEMCCDVCS
jgi:hypothetical protein